MKATPSWHASTTYLRHLIEYGTAVSWLSSTTSVYEAKPTPGLQTISPTAANVSDSMAVTHLGLQYLLVCPQGSVLGPLLFLAYTIDLPNCVVVSTSCDQFADDTALTTVCPTPTECEGHLQRSVDATSAGLSDWKLAVNVDKTVSMEFTRRPFSSDFAINPNGNTLKKVKDISAWSLLQTCGGQPTSTSTTVRRDSTLVVSFSQVGLAFCFFFPLFFLFLFFFVVCCRIATLSHSVAKKDIKSIPGKHCLQKCSSLCGAGEPFFFGPSYFFSPSRVAFGVLMLREQRK